MAHRTDDLRIYALPSDSQRRGMAIRYAKIGSLHTDGIHTFHEMAMYGTQPWSSTARDLVFWGSTHLSGWAANRHGLHTWDALQLENNLPIDIDLYEKSSCAHPIVHANQLAGVLMLSSTQMGFFSDPLMQKLVHEYALLLTLAFDHEEFQPFECLNLRMMPDLQWQRAQINSMYIPRVLSRAQQYNLIRKEAEAMVRDEMENEFEAEVRSRYDH